MSQSVLEDAPAVVEVADGPLPEIQQHHWEIVLALEQAGAFTPTQLVLETELPYDQAEAVAHFLGAIKRRSSWWVGDLLVYSEAAYGEQFAQLALATGLHEQTLLNLAYVSRHVPPQRRLAELPHSVHAEVAPLGAREQKRWLEKAREKQWTRAELRAHMKAKRRDEQPPLPGDDAEPGSLMEVAQAILRDAREADDPGFWLVPSEGMARLRAVLGQEE